MMANINQLSSESEKVFFFFLNKKESFFWLSCEMQEGAAGGSGTGK